MAKGNLLLGYGRGKVGSLVFSRRKGEQIVRARNTAPANPRTNAQLNQRMKMYAPVKLYRQSMERFFKYAFSVKERETIFNAFMRENIALAPWTSRELVTAQAPIPFPARMSSGSVGGFFQVPTYADDDSILEANDFSVGKIVDAAGDGTTASVVLCLTAPASEVETIGELSSAILASQPTLQIGDQITLVAVGTTGLLQENGMVDFDGEHGFIFNYHKFVIDTESTLLLSSTPLNVIKLGNLLYVQLALPFGWEEGAFGGTVIVTRNVGSKVDASNSSLVLSSKAQSIYNFMRTDSWKSKAAASYKASPDAYLNPATTVNE